MKQRIGLILALTGAILLLQPDLDVQIILQDMTQLAMMYWPIVLILIGLLLITPRKKKKTNITLNV